MDITSILNNITTITTDISTITTNVKTIGDLKTEHMEKLRNLSLVLISSIDHLDDLKIHEETSK